MAFLLAYLKVPLTWGEIFRRTFRDAFGKDNCFGMAAELSYYFFFSLFPALLVLVAFASYFPLDSLIDELFRTMGGFVPPEALQIITDQIKKISEGEDGGLLTIGMALALWSSATAMTSVIDTLNRAYDIEEGRPWWKVRLIAMALTVGVALFILVSFALVLLGPTIAEWLAAHFYLGRAFVVGWSIAQWPVVFALACTGIALIYYFAPDAEQDWVFLTPGSIFATTLWLLSSLGFKYYVATWGDYDAYGAIGAVMILMLWFYISALVILIGAEMNAEIEHAAPYGKEEGEKVPGQRKMIGSAAMRAWMARRLRRGDPKTPSAKEVKEAEETGTAEDGVPVSPAPAMAFTAAKPRLALPPARRFTDWLIAGGVLGTEILLTAVTAKWLRRRTPG